MSVISEDEMSEVVEGVWMTVLELPVLPGVRSDLDGHNFMLADIEISGAWEGSVHLKASENFLTSAAAHIFAKDVSDVDQEDREGIEGLAEIILILTVSVRIDKGRNHIVDPSADKRRAS